jgi:hypothetical protein
MRHLVMKDQLIVLLAPVSVLLFKWCFNSHVI